MKHKRSQAGFSLIELLTVIAVMGVVTTLGTRMFIWVSSEWNTTRTQMELNVRATQIIDSVREDCSHILSSRLTQQGIVGVNAEEKVKTYELIQLDDDSIQLPVQIMDTTTGKTERNLVTYRIDRTEEQRQLVRESKALNGEANGTTLVAEGVLALSIEYKDGAEWRLNWAKKTMPDALRISVTLQDPARTREQISRQAVIAIQVN